MATADYNGDVYVSVHWIAGSDSSSMRTRQFACKATNSMGAIADAVATYMGVTTGAVSLMALRTVNGILPVIDARSTALSASTIVNGGDCVLVAGS